MSKVLLGEMNLEDVRQFFKKGDTAIVPIGTTEQHGPHLPYLTDTLIPTEIAERVAGKIGAAVAPALPYGLSQSHIGFPGIIWLSGKTLVSVIEEVALSLAQSGFRRIVFINGHYCNDQPLFVGITDATNNPKLPKGTRIYGLTYWNTMEEKALDNYLSWKAGWHANIGETSAVLAINSKIVDMTKAVAEWPKVKKNTPALNIMAQQSSVFGTYSKSGVWGDGTKASRKLGEKFLREITDGVVATIKTYEASFLKDPVGKKKRRK